MASSEPAAAKPLIVILTLNKPDVFNDIFEGFVDELSAKAEVRQAHTQQEARAAFTSDPKPTAILSADEGLTFTMRFLLVHRALSYVRAGGIFIFMGLFSSCSRPSEIKNLFTRLDLPWQSGAYERSTFKLNREMTHFDTSGLVKSYSQKALHLANITLDDAVHLATDDSVIESIVFGPRRVTDRTQTPAAFTKVGEGRVGYVGDVNNENATTPLILALCGL